MKNYHDIIIGAVLTEKADDEREKNVYVFKVKRDANKKEIKKAVENIFEVRVTRVNTVNVKGKMKRARMRYWTETQGYKKAYVKVHEDDMITLFEGI